jgi:hypothetical protein
MRSRIIESLQPWQRILLKIDVDLATGCWNYTGSIINTGYPQICWRENGRKRYKLAHRIIFEQFKGPIPEGREVCHSCDNPRCVNPEHLWHGSRAQNMKDAFDKNRTKNTFTLAVLDERKEKRRAYQREWHREYRRRKREQS